jgi:hypothetical protein
MTPLKRTGNWGVKGEQEGREFKLNNQVQQYMRETLKKLYLKNRHEGEGNAPAIKQSEHSSMVRELLINIENIRDFQNTCEVNPNPNCAKENGGEILQEIAHSARTPQRKLYHLGHHHQHRHVLDLNQ